MPVVLCRNPRKRNIGGRGRTKQLCNKVYQKVWFVFFGFEILFSKARFLGCFGALLNVVFGSVLTFLCFLCCFKL